jgi:hypothetical protein
MTPTEIIKSDAIERNIDPSTILVSLRKHLETGVAVMLRKNDSVLVLNEFDGHAMELHLFTKDTPLTLARSIKYFVDKIKASDIEAVYGKADNAEIIEMLRRLGVPVENSDRPDFNWMARV